MNLWDVGSKWTQNFLPGRFQNRPGGLHYPCSQVMVKYSNMEFIVKEDRPRSLFLVQSEMRSKCSCRPDHAKPLEAWAPGLKWEIMLKGLNPPAPIHQKHSIKNPTSIKIQSCQKITLNFQGHNPLASFSFSSLMNMIFFFSIILFSIWKTEFWNLKCILIEQHV